MWALFIYSFAFSMGPDIACSRDFEYRLYEWLYYSFMVLGMNFLLVLLVFTDNVDLAKNLDLNSTIIFILISYSLMIFTFTSYYGSDGEAPPPVCQAKELKEQT
jgi:hypothetical protein